MGPCCEQTRAAFEVGLSLDQGQGVYSGWSDVDGSSQLRLCHTCIVDVMGMLQITIWIQDVNEGRERVITLCGVMWMYVSIHVLKAGSINLC